MIFFSVGFHRSGISAVKYGIRALSPSFFFLLIEVRVPSRNFVLKGQLSLGISLGGTLHTCTRGVE